MTAVKVTARQVIHAGSCGHCRSCQQAEKAGQGKVHCLAHPDENASLSISSKDGVAVWKCWSGCTQADVLNALKAKGILPDMPRPGRRRLIKMTKFPYVDATGAVLRYHQRKDYDSPPKGLAWLMPDGTASKAGETHMEDLPLYRLPDLLKAPPDEPVYLVEGETCADALAGRGLLAVSLGGGAEQPRFGAALDPLAGRDVLLWPDNDDPGRRLMQRVAAALEGKARSARILGVPNMPPKGDGVDFFAAGRTVDELRTLAAAAEPYESDDEPDDGPTARREDDGRPTISLIEEDLKHLGPLTWRALQAKNAPERLFRHGGGLARIMNDESDAPLLQRLGVDELAHELARAAIFEQLTDMSIKVVHPPAYLVRDLLADPDPPLPPLSRVVEVPVFAADCTLQIERGYHAASRTYFAPPAGVHLRPVSSAPSRADVEAAVSLLQDELLIDFYFASDADRANAIGLFLLSFVRDMIDGPTPLHSIEAATPGTGKGLLAEVLLSPSSGQHIGIVPQAADDEEWRKRLTARLLEGRPVLLIDNVRRPMDSGVLCAALTATYWEDRILGKTQTVRVPLRNAWVCTGNNINYSTEMLRRTVRIRLDADREKPWERPAEGFRHPRLRQWVHEHRADLVHAGLTMVQAWIAAGKPEGRRTLGSFEDWARVIGGILDVAGVPDFLANAGDFYELADAEGAAWRAFVAAWLEQYGTSAVGAATLRPIAATIEGIDLGTGEARSQATRLGVQIKQRRDQVINDYRIVHAGTKQRAAQWRLIPTHDLLTPKDTENQVNLVNLVNVSDPSQRDGHARAHAPVEVDDPERFTTFTGFTDMCPVHGVDMRNRDDDTSWCPICAHEPAVNHA